VRLEDPPHTAKSKKNGLRVGMLSFTKTKATPSRKAVQ
jgi:hypothetical protein